MRLGLLDKSYRKAADKVWKLRANIWYVAVRLFAALSAKKGNLQGKDCIEVV